MCLPLLSVVNQSDKRDDAVYRITLMYVAHHSRQNN